MSLVPSKVPISNGYLTKIIAERARIERPDFIAQTSTNEVQKALAGKPLEEVVRSAPVTQETALAPESTKVIKLEGGRVSIVNHSPCSRRWKVGNPLLLAGREWSGTEIVILSENLPY